MLVGSKIKLKCLTGYYYGMHDGKRANSFKL